jgi:hypothetical protein
MMMGGGGGGELTSGGEAAGAGGELLAVIQQLEAEGAMLTGKVGITDAEALAAAAVAMEAESTSAAESGSGTESTAGGSTQTPAESSAGVSARFVVHGTGESTVTLPAEGGTVVVDLIVSTDAPIIAFEATPAAGPTAEAMGQPAADVIAINTAGWSARDNVLASYDTEGSESPSAPTAEAMGQPYSGYDFTVMGWMLVYGEGDLAYAEDDIVEGTDPAVLLEQDPPDLLTASHDLDPLAGPISVPSGDWFTAPAPLGGIVSEALPAGETVVATLSLTVSGYPGTYNLILTGGTFVDDAGAEGAIIPDASLAISVESE